MPKPGDKPHNYIQLKPEHVALLGKMKDTELAKLAGIGKTAIWRKRNQLGIPPFKPYATGWNPNMDALLGTRPDGELGKIWGKSENAVRQRRNILGIDSHRSKQTLKREKLFEDPYFLKNVGKMSDTKLSLRCGVSVDTIRKARLDLDIPAYNIESRDWQGMDGQDDSVHGGRLSREAKRVCKMMAKWR